MYLLSACALSFKPLLRLFAKALHLQGFVTHTKSTVGVTRSHVKRTFTSTHTQPEVFELGNVSEFGRFHRLSDHTTSSSTGGVDEGRLEVTVTKTIELDSERRLEDELWDRSDVAGDHFGRAV